MATETSLLGFTVDEHVKTGMGRVHRVLKLAMELKGLQSYSDYAGVNRSMVAFRKSISKIMQDVLVHQDIKLQLGDEHLLEDKFELLRDANDCLLERINSELDEAQGIRRTGSADLPPPALTSIAVGHPASSGRGSMVLLASRNVQKPQLFFSQKIDNSVKTPFLPIIKYKPNSKKPLAIMLCITDNGREYYSHPYEYELQHWQPNEALLQHPRTAVPPPPLHQTPLIFVDTPAALQQTVEELRRCTEVAVDVEHHAFRSYLGLTSLIQMSSRTTDYIVDPLKLRGQLEPLNEIFTHADITKVIHGADSDVLWLQRDCGLYLVNLFDTHQAAVALDFPQRSLAALLATFCNVQADKSYQRADWRIRPLPPDFIEYARQDTHHLLYIHDLLHNMLLERTHGTDNLLRSVYSRGTELCLKRYDKPEVGPHSYRPLLSRSRKQFNNQQEHALRELFLWRDRVARDHDESTDFVLPRHMLLQMAEVLPKELQGVLACCNPVPPLVKTELLQIHSIIHAARDQPLAKVVQSRLELLASVVGSGSGRCLHDLSHAEDAPGLPCLLDGVIGRESSSQETMFGDLFQEDKIRIGLKASSDLYGELKKIEEKIDTVREIISKYLSPYERHRLYRMSKVKPVSFDTVDKQKNVPRAEEVTVTNDERIARIREHFQSLIEPSPPSDDQQRVARLLAHFRSAMSGTGSSSEGGCSSPTISGDKRSVAAVGGDEESDSSDSSDSSTSSSSDEFEEEEASTHAGKACEPVAQNSPLRLENNLSESSSSVSSSSDDSDTSDESSDDDIQKVTSVENNVAFKMNKVDTMDSSTDNCKELSLNSSTNSVASKQSSCATKRLSPANGEGQVEPKSKKSKVSEDESECKDDEPREQKNARKRKRGIRNAKSCALQVEPFNYDKANFKMFSNKKRGGKYGGRGKGRGGKRARGGPSRGRH